MKMLIVNTVTFKQNGMTNVICQQFNNIDGLSCQCDIAGSNEVVEPLKQNVKEKKRNTFILPNRKKNIISYLIRFISICKNNNYDVVYIHGNSSTMALEVLAARLANVKIRVVHGHSISSEHLILHKLLNSAMLKLSTHRVTCSEMAGHFLYGFSNFIVIPNSFDLEKFAFNPDKRNEIRELLKLDNKIVWGYVATLTSNKNHEFLLDTFKCFKEKNENAVLILIGKGHCELKIKTKIQDLNLSDSVLMLGERSDVYDLINAFDCVVFPSQYEGLGIALLEAQANGLPVIATADTIPSEVKVNSNFKFCSLSSADDWYQNVMQMKIARDVNAYSNMKQSCFSKKSQSEKWNQLMSDFDSF